MLEVSILKCVHKGEQEARKLIPYINSCDVFSCETAAATETYVQYAEKNWEQVINSGCSRTHFLKQLSAVTVKSENLGMGREGQDDFNNKICDYLFRSKVPVWHVERLSEEEKNTHDLLMKEASDCNKQAIQLMHQNKYEEILPILYNAVGNAVEAGRLRDMHIGRNLDTAEERIRERYGQLKSKEPLRFAVSIGYQHKPEKYTRIQTTVHNLQSQDYYKSSIGDLLHEERAEGKSCEEMRHVLLAAGVLLLSRYKKVEIPPSGIINMSEKELINAITTKPH